MSYGLFKINIPHKIKITFVMSMVIGIATHGFMMSNKYPNWDDLGQLWDDMNRGKSGRWFLRFPAGISSMLSMPWIGGLLTILYIGLAACLVVNLLKLKKTSSCILAAGIMLVFPSIGGNMFYVNSADAYAFGLLLMCAGVWACARYRFGWIIGVACTVLSLGIYQAYFAIGCVLFVLVLIGQVLEGKNKFIEIFKNACIYLGTLVLSMVVYVPFTRYYQKRVGGTSYNGLDTLGETNLTTILKDIGAAYKGIVDFFINDMYEFHGLFIYVFIVLCIVSIYQVVELICLKKMKLGHTVFLMVLLLIVPLACGITYLMGADGVHLLMQYGFIGIFLTFIYINDIRVSSIEEGTESKRAWIASVICLGIALCIATMEGNYIVKTNMGYFASHISYEQTYSYSTQLLTSIKLEAGKEETEIQKVFLVEKPEIDIANAGTGWLYKKMFVYFTGLPYNMTQDGSYPQFLNKYCGFTHPISYTYMDRLESDEAELVRQMPVYPAEGSIVCTDDGVVYVKMKHE